MPTCRAKVSIIVPVYNAEQYLHECLDSCIHQTLRDIELILIDDFSTDASAGICERYAAQDARIRVVHNSTNLGEGASRNKGIEIASGEYLGFVDADDYVDNAFYEKLHRAAKAGSADIAKGVCVKIWPDGVREKQEKMNAKITLGLKQGQPLFGLFSCEHTTALFRTDIVTPNKKIRYPAIKIALDDVFLLKATYFMKSIVLVHDAYYYYRQHAASVSSVKDRSYYDSTLMCFEHCIAFLNECEVTPADYNRVFRKFSGHVVDRYREMQNDDTLKACAREFLNDFLKALTMYAMIDSAKIEKIITELSRDSVAESKEHRGTNITISLRRLISRLFSK